MSQQEQLVMFDMTPTAMRRTKTRSTSEAKRLLAKHRKTLIMRGREAAEKICKRKGTCHSRQVRDQLAKAGLLNQPNVGEYWLGAVFTSSMFEWTGEYHKYSDPARNIHERTVRIWRLK